MPDILCAILASDPQAGDGGGEFGLGERLRQPRQIGARPGRDLGTGVLLVAVIGIPGLGLYALGRLMGITVAYLAASEAAKRWFFSRDRRYTKRRGGRPS